MKTLADYLPTGGRERIAANLSHHKRDGLAPSDSLCLALFEELLALVVQTERAHEDLLVDMEKRIQRLEAANV